MNSDESLLLGWNIRVKGLIYSQLEKLLGLYYQPLLIEKQFVGQRTFEAKTLVRRSARKCLLHSLSQKGLIYQAGRLQFSCYVQAQLVLDMHFLHPRASLVGIPNEIRERILLEVLGGANMRHYSVYQGGLDDLLLIISTLRLICKRFNVGKTNNAYSPFFRQFVVRLNLLRSGISLPPSRRRGWGGWWHIFDPRKHRFHITGPRLRYLDGTVSDATGYLRNLDWSSADNLWQQLCYNRPVPTTLRLRAFQEEIIVLGRLAFFTEYKPRWSIDACFSLFDRVKNIVLPRLTTVADRKIKLMFWIPFEPESSSPALPRILPMDRDFVELDFICTPEFLDADGLPWTAVSIRRTLHFHWWWTVPHVPDGSTVLPLRMANDANLRAGLFDEDFSAHFLRMLNLWGGHTGENVPRTVTITETSHHVNNAWWVEEPVEQDEISEDHRFPCSC